ncbi:hypothetical protein DL93DRAFT_2090783 [Clavulina sp. PMI_390]|nr:hypothetical protein DL93DRAFT_2090783 [Clavulina sp. PMI_390]
MSSLSKKNHLARTETGLSTPVEIRVNISATVTLNTPSPEKGHAKRRREEESWDDYASDDDAKLARKRPKVDGPVPDEMDLAASLAAALGNSQTATSFMSTALAETFSNQGLTSLGNTAPEDITSGTSSGLNLFNWEPSFQQTYTEGGQLSFSASSLSSFSLFQQDGNMN